MNLKQIPIIGYPVGAVDLLKISGLPFTGAKAEAVFENKLNIFKQLEKLYGVIPKKIKLSKKQKRIVDGYLADLYFWQFGYNGYLKLDDHKSARKYFLKGLRLRPFNLKFWKTYFLRGIL